MVVVNTRKRKPPALDSAAEHSALAQLASLSAQQLRSRGPGAELSDSSDSTSVYSGDLPLRRMRSKPRKKKHHRAESSEDDDAERTPTLAPQVPSQKRRRVRDVDVHELAEQVESMRMLLRRAERAAQDDDWSSPSVHEEILRLQASVDAMLARGPFDRGASSQGPAQTVRGIHAAIQSVQTLLTGSRNQDLVALYMRPPLEFVWQQGRKSAEQDLRSHLTFWKHKAQDLRERLRVSLEKSGQQADPAMRDAFDFVSTFYLLDMVPDTTPIEVSAREKSLETANNMTFDQLRKLDLHRVRELGVMQPTSAPSTSDGPFSERRSIPAVLPINSEAASSGLRHSRPSSASSVTNVLEDNNEGDDPSEEDEPLPMQPSTPLSNTGISSKTAAASMTGESGQEGVGLIKSSTPSVKAGSSKRDSVALPLRARQRLKLLLESQLNDLPAGGPAGLAGTVTQTPRSQATASHPTVSASAKTVSKKPSTNLSSKSVGGPAAGAVSVDQRDTGSSGRAKVGNSATKSSKPTAASTLDTQARSNEFGHDHGNSLPDPASKDASSPGNDDDESDSDAELATMGTGCLTCGRNDSYASLLLCDNECGSEFHTFCLTPPLAKIPEGDWYCPKCLEKEGIKPGDHIYLCSASMCDKITGAKYCSTHRCQFQACLNRASARGFCRRHDTPEATRRASASSQAPIASTPIVSKTTTMAKSSNTTPAPLSTTTAPTTANSNDASSGLTSTSTSGAVPVLREEQLMKNMRQMGIWLPSDLMSNITKRTTNGASGKASQPPSSAKRQ